MLCTGSMVPNSRCVTSSKMVTNMTVEEQEWLTGKDASWIITTSVIIFTMQTGDDLL